MDLVVLVEALAVPLDCSSAASDPDLALLSLDEFDDPLGDYCPNEDPVLVGVMGI